MRRLLHTARSLGAVMDQFHLTAGQKRLVLNKSGAPLYSAQSLVQRLSKPLQRVQAHVLRGRPVPVLHQQLLAQAVLTSRFSDEQLAILHTAPLPEQARTDAWWFDQFYCNEMVESEAPSSVGLTLESIGLPWHLWMNNPWTIPQVNDYWREDVLKDWRDRDEDDGDDLKLRLPSTTNNSGARQHMEQLRQRQADLVRRELDGRIVWFGGWTEAIWAFTTTGYFLGDVEATQREGCAAWLSRTCIDECRHRLQHGNQDWSALPVVEWDHYMRPGNESNYGLRYHSSLADYVSSWHTTDPTNLQFLRDVSDYHHIELRSPAQVIVLPVGSSSSRWTKHWNEDVSHPLRLFGLGRPAALRGGACSGIAFDGGRRPCMCEGSDERACKCAEKL